MLFNSQNNAKGGYPWRGDPTGNGVGDPVSYYEGSKLRLEWTVQHACGANPKIHCNVIFQYACEDTIPQLRDGYPTGALAANDDTFPGYQKRLFTDANQNQDGTNRIPDEAASNDKVEFAMHENFEYYQSCKNTRRNEGLYIADRNLNGVDARYTRQNNGATRYGFECPEEREYYPYWRESPWKDIVVLVSDESWCDYYQAQSQNSNGVDLTTEGNNNLGYCVMTEEQRLNSPNDKIPIDQIQCQINQGVWTPVPDKGLPPPDCQLHEYSRDNHLGNVAGKDGEVPVTASYVWTIPETAGGAETQECVVRIRYNMSSADYEAFSDVGPVPGFDYKHNCQQDLKNTEDAPETITFQGGCYDLPLTEATPRRERAYVDFMSESRDTHGDNVRLGLATNTNQIGRTFQDRSHVFRISKRPDALRKDSIWNVNVRGRRGNIVQTYPATEYDFVPQDIKASSGTLLHFHFHGSDFNPQRNPNNGEGWRYSDRSNLVEVDNLNMQIPSHKGELGGFWEDEAEMVKFALGGQDETTCDNTYIFGSANDQAEQNNIANCGKLNSMNQNVEYIKELGKKGSYTFISTRNNNFSNRAQKLNIIVT